MATPQHDRKRPRRTFTMDDAAFEHLTYLAEAADVSRSRFLEQLVLNDHAAYEQFTTAAASAEVSPCALLDQSVYLEADAYERLTDMASQARANRSQFLEHLVLRAEAIYNFQPPPPPLPRPWWKLWGKGPKPLELPTLVADIRNPAPR